MKYFASLLFLLTVLNGCQTTSAIDTAKSGTFKVVTLNLYHDKDDWPKRRLQIVEELRALQPDVIALQEVIQHQTVDNQATWLAAQLGYESHFVSIDPANQVRRYGNAILTRHPILVRGEQRLRPLDDSRTAAWLRIDLDGRALNVYATHLHWTDEGAAIRVQQVADLMQYIAATSKGFPSVVAGDFNATADSSELAVVRTDFVDAYGSQHPDADIVSSSTLNLKYFAPKRIDHIFFKRDAIQPVSSQIILNRADAHGVWASDHYGMLAILRLDSANGPAPAKTLP